MKQKKNVSMTMKKKTVTKRKPIPSKHIKKRKIRYGRIFLVFLILFLLFYLATNLIRFPIRNILIKGNIELEDQEIIELIGIEDYPSIFKYSISEMEKKLKRDVRIEKATVKKKNFKLVMITIQESIPIFYNQNTNKTILSTKEEIDECWEAPVLINYVPDTKYDLFLKQMLEITPSILKRVSEIKYEPNNVDDERFLFTMTDGNYVYLTLDKFNSINHYVTIYADITAKYGNKKGILNLDSGDYFTILE